MGNIATFPLETVVVASAKASFRDTLAGALSASGCRAEKVVGGAEALARLEGSRSGLVVLDRWLPDLDVGELVGMVKARSPRTDVFVVDSETGGMFMPEKSPRSPRSGDLVRILKGLTASAAAACHQIGDREDTETTAIEPNGSEVPEPDTEPLSGMIGASPAMRRLYRLCRLVAPRSTTALITGETGTGKELVARAIHQLSSRYSQPFITVNCSAIPEPLIESELFGYARGAFTGAFQSRMGRIHSAHDGTLFLDEIAELPLSMQAKLLRFLQEGEVQRLGCPDTIRVDVRVIAATNQNLAERVAQRLFRQDLYYRISVFPVHIAPLRDHPEDILALASSFLRSFCAESHVARKAISRDSARLLEQHAWPGNVRELRHVIERAFILAAEETELLPEHILFPDLVPKIRENLTQPAVAVLPRTHDAKCA